MMDKIRKNDDSSDGEERVMIEEAEDPSEDIEIYLKEGEYNVEKILDMRVKNGSKQYFVKWEGYPSSQNTWEPAAHLSNINSIIKQFETEYAKKNPKQGQKQKKSDSAAVKQKDGQSKKHKASSPLKEEVIVKKTKFNPKGENNEEDGKNDKNSPDSDRASNFEFDFSDDDKGKSDKPDENKVNNSVSRKEVQNKAVVKPEGKIIKPNKVVNKEIQQKKLQVLNKKRDKIGSFKNRDKPKEILGIKPGKNNEFYFLVEWEKRSDGVKPENSHVSNSEFRTYDSAFLLDFYESKIVIFARKQGITDNLKEKQLPVSVDDLKSDSQSPSKPKTQLLEGENMAVSSSVEKILEETGKIDLIKNSSLEDMARDLDFQTMEDTNGNFMNLNSDVES